MPDSAKIGIVTVTYNSAEVIPEFMESLLKQTYREFRLYVIDNCSSDATLSRLAAYPDPRIVVVRSPVNVGVAEGNNIGIRMALSDGCTAVLLINNDTEFGPELVSTLHDGLEKYRCAMIAPKILYSDSHNKIWSAGGAFSLLRGRSKHLGFNQRDDGQFDEVREVAYSPTCCMLIRRQVFEDIGMMDPNYFIYFDDADFCLRAHRSGLRLVYTPEVKLFHKVSSLIGHRSEVSVRYVTRNHVYFVLKHYQPWQNLYYLPACLAHAVVRCVLAKNKTKAALIAGPSFWEGISVFRSSRRSAERRLSSGSRLPIAPSTPRTASNEGRAHETA